MNTTYKSVMPVGRKITKDGDPVCPDCGGVEPLCKDCQRVGPVIKVEWICCGNCGERVNSAITRRYNYPIIEDFDD